MFRNRHSRFALAVVAALVLTISAVQLSAAGKGNPNPGVTPPQANYRGLSYGEWSARWWQWCFEQPAEGHPLSDITGEDAAVGQEGNVWFLGGLWWTNDGEPPEGLVTRTIEIPAGTALFFPIVNGENNEVEIPEMTIDEIRDFMAGIFDAFDNDNMYCTIDGVELRDLVRYRTISPVFSIWLPEGNLLGIEEGEIEEVVADGYYVMVPPLPVGKHVITFGVMDLDWSMDIKYEITVVPTSKKK